MHCKKLENRFKSFVSGIDIQQSNQEAKKKGLMKGLFFGGLVGTVLGILYAPEKGEVTRQKTKDEIQRLKEQMEDHLDQGKERASELLEEKKGRAEEIWLSTKTGLVTEPEDTEEESETENK